MYDFKKIKEHYEYLTPIIFKQSERKKDAWVSPYSSYIEWPPMFSPIEMQTWMALRGFGHCPMYPQYPVDKFFIDFGNPVVKVAIECDGKEWHTDKEKDKKRDLLLSKQDWITYRISGSDCFRIEEKYDEIIYEDESEQLQILQNFYTTVEGFIKAISIFHFGYKTYNRFVNEYELAANCLLLRISLNKDKAEEKFSKIISENIADIPKDLKSQTFWI